MPSISWRKNGQTVTSGSKFSFDQYKKRLTIRNLIKADEGDYECHVTSSLSPQPRTSKANLTVFGKQMFLCYIFGIAFNIMLSLRLYVQ